MFWNAITLPALHYAVAAAAQRAPNPPLSHPPCCPLKSIISHKNKLDREECGLLELKLKNLQDKLARFLQFPLSAEGLAVVKELKEVRVELAGIIEDLVYLYMRPGKPP